MLNSTIDGGFLAPESAPIGMIFHRFSTEADAAKGLILLKLRNNFHSFHSRRTGKAHRAIAIANGGRSGYGKRHNGSEMIKSSQL